MPARRPSSTSAHARTTTPPVCAPACAQAVAELQDAADVAARRLSEALIGMREHKRALQGAASAALPWLESLRGDDDDDDAAGMLSWMTEDNQNHMQGVLSEKAFNFA